MSTPKISAVHRFVLALSERQRLAREASKLRAMPDHRLKDMGLTRAEVDAVEPFHKRHHGAVSPWVSLGRLWRQ